MIKFSRINNITGWFIFAIASIVYLMTMESSASWWDCGEFIAATYKLQVVHPPGAPIFLMMGRIFTLFASSPEQVPVMTNIFSALSTSFSVLFCFWIITRLSRKMIAGNNEPDNVQTALIMGSGIVGALACTFIDSMWFSAVESEVYALATFFFALIFWAMIKWEEHANTHTGDRWIIFIFLMLGLSMGVHLLGLLAIPAIGLIYYFKNYEYTRKGFWVAFGISFLVLAFILFGVLDKLIGVAATLDRTFVNGFGAPFGTGALLFSIIIMGAALYGIWYSIKNKKRILYLTLVSFTMMMIGLSSYAMVLVRAAAEPVINMNGINDVNSFLSYLKREQYGSRDLVFGPLWTAQPLDIEYTKDKWGRVEGEDKYVSIGKDFKIIYDLSDQQLSGAGLSPQQIAVIKGRNKEVIFPRMGSLESRHAGLYYNFVGVPSDQQQTYVPTYGDNMKYFFNYQLGFMYWRYFMWNFSGRQNDEQGFYHEGMKNGNWITGITAIDKMKNPNLQDLPESLLSNDARNKYYMIPFILGLLGMVYQIRKDRNGFIVIFLFFFFMGAMNLINSNQPPVEPRERDYALVGAFFAFAIWIGFGLLALYDLGKSIDRKKLTEYLLYSGIIMIIFFITGLTVYDFDSFIALLVYSGVIIMVLSLISGALFRSLKNEKVIAIILTVICLSAPILMGSQGWDDHNRHGRTLARDFAQNYLESCPQNAILFTQGDNDTYPLWYAQEVEGIRTDIRIINLSLLGVDWYINQLRHATNDAGKIDLMLGADKILGDKRNAIRFDQNSKFKNRTLDLKEVVLFMGNDKQEALNAQGENYIPSQNLKVTIDSASVAGNNVVDESLKNRIVKELNFTLKNTTLLKNDLMLLDIIASNISKRPICFAITVSPDAYLGLDKYFMQTGMAYRVTPVENEGNGFNRSVNTDITYDLLVNHQELFNYGGVENGEKMHLDPSSEGSILTSKYVNYQQLAGDLIQEKMNYEQQATQMLSQQTDISLNEVGNGLQETAKERGAMALTVMDLMMEKFPASSFPYDYNMINAANYYQMLGNNEKALEIVKALKEICLDDLAYYYAMYNNSADNFLTRVQYESDMRDAERCLASAVNVAKKANETELSASIQQEWNSLRTSNNLPSILDEKPATTLPGQ
ncbi:MAG: DUF2723 domain-containing protein [Chitinophagales bacterium]|nr:DUF2723 domain-containing protein [Chitinophagales bacterium]